MSVSGRSANGVAGLISPPRAPPPRAPRTREPNSVRFPPSQASPPPAHQSPQVSPPQAPPAQAPPPHAPLTQAPPPQAHQSPQISQLSDPTSTQTVETPSRGIPDTSSFLDAATWNTPTATPPSSTLYINHDNDLPSKEDFDKILQEISPITTPETCCDQCTSGLQSPFNPTQNQSARAFEAWRNQTLERTHTIPISTSTPLAWKLAREKLVKRHATKFSLRVVDVLVKCVTTSRVSLERIGTGPVVDRRRPVPPDVHVDRDGAKRLLEILEEEPGCDDLFFGPKTEDESQGADMEGAGTGAGKAGDMECWMGKFQEFWWTVFFLSSNLPFTHPFQDSMVRIFEALYSLCYKHEESCDGTCFRGGEGDGYAGGKGFCWICPGNPFRKERYLWFWERLPECWNGFEAYAPLSRSFVDTNPEKSISSTKHSKPVEVKTRNKIFRWSNTGSFTGSMPTTYHNCILGVEFMPFAPTGDLLESEEWIRLNAFLARFTRLLGEKPPFVHEGGPPYMVLWLKGMYAMIEAFEVMPDADNIRDRQAELVCERLLAHLDGMALGEQIGVKKAILEDLGVDASEGFSKDRLRDWVRSHVDPSLDPVFAAEEHVWATALGAASVWILYGNLTPSRLEKTTHLLQKSHFEGKSKDRLSDLVDIQFLRHPYASGHLNPDGLLLSWEWRYTFWARRLSWIIEHQRRNLERHECWIYKLAVQAHRCMEENWLEAVTGYLATWPKGFLLDSWEREIEASRVAFRNKGKGAAGKRVREGRVGKDGRVGKGREQHRFRRGGQQSRESAGEEEKAREAADRKSVLKKLVTDLELDGGLGLEMGVLRG